MHSYTFLFPAARPAALPSACLSQLDLSKEDINAQPYWFVAP